MKTILALIVIIGLAAAGYWYLNNSHHQESLERAQEQASRQAEQLKTAVKDRIKDFHLSTPEVKDELDRTGQVVRKKAQQVGAAIADATADSRITASVKGKLLKDATLAALSIHVSTTDGLVTLSGRANSPEDVAEAMKLALDTDGVREVISTLQVKGPK